LQTKTLPLACFNLTITPSGFTFWQIEQRSVLGTARVFLDGAQARRSHLRESPNLRHLWRVSSSVT
jgi:hypothetical protein